jgi:hypothetical protein
MGAWKKGPAEQQLEQLDGVFGPETYFLHSRLLITAARDLTGVMKVAHKLQARVHGEFGAICEVFMEHVKQELWMKLHETTLQLGVQKGPEVADVQVTYIPEGIRVHPYKREHLPTLEALLLWEDASGATRGHCIYSVSHPQLPSLEQVDEIFDIIQPYFAKRWLIVELRLAPPTKGDFEEADAEAEKLHDAYVGANVEVTVLACHPYGFARNQADSVVHVKQCQPLAFKGISDDAGRARLCFLPADINKVQVAETERFYGTEAVLPKSQIFNLHDGPTIMTIDLTPKAFSTTTVHVFAMPAKLPSAEETEGIVDWASEEREALLTASVEITPLKDGATSIALAHIGNGDFAVPDGEVGPGGLPEGCVSILIDCPGYVSEERTVMLLVGANDFYVPLRKADY